MDYKFKEGLIEKNKKKDSQVRLVTMLNKTKKLGEKKK